MQEVDFFTPIEFSDKNKAITQSLLQLTDSYFYLGGKKACVIPGNQKGDYEGVTLKEGSPHFLTTALKVASYLTLVLPALMLVLKVVLRSLHDFYIIEPQVEKKGETRKANDVAKSYVVDTTTKPNQEKQQQSLPLIQLPKTPPQPVVTPPYTFIPPPPVVTPPLPPLPHIFDKQLDPASPLLNDLPNKLFINSDPKTLANLKLAAFFGSDPIALFGNEMIDQKFLDIPLSFWIKQDPKEYKADDNLKIMNDPARAAMKKIIDERIQNLQKEIQLIERLSRKHCTSKIKDLLPAWPKSPLKLKLLMEDEIGLLKTSSIDSFGNEMVWDAIGRDNILKLGQQKMGNNLPAYITKDEIKNILLVDLVKLKADQIHACVDVIPPLALLLIDKAELQKIEIDRLTANQLDLLVKATFYNSHSQKWHYFIENLTSSQIKSLIPLLKDKKPLENLSAEQILQLDFSKMDQELFNIVLASGSYSKTPEVLPQLDIATIYQLSFFFSKGHWRLIGEKHKEALDMTKIDQSKRQLAFEAIYTTYDSEASNLLPKLPLDKIYDLIPYFGEKHWRCIGDAHKLALDFNKIEQSKRACAFNQMFSTYDSEASNLLPQLPVDKIYEVVPHFTEKHWRCIGDAHKIALDFTKIEQSKRAWAFTQMFSTYDSEASNLLPKLPLDKIYEVIPYFSEKHWKCLGDAHKLALDFTKIEQSKRAWAFTQMFSTYDSEASNLLPQLPLNKIYEVIPYFSEKHWACIEDAQKIAFDFSKIEENNRRFALQMIFGTYGGDNSSAARLLPKLNKIQKDFIRPYLNKEAAKFL